MSSCVFAFGTGNTWFFESPAMWKWGDLPTTVHSRFPKVGENSAGSKIDHVHNLVFGANGSYMISWKGKDGRDYAVNHGLPANLTAWLDKKDNKGFLVRDVVNLRLALGPNNSSFFVTDGKNYLWQGLPAELDASIEKLRKKGGGFTSNPKIVCLGVNSSYIMITEGGGGSWNLSKDYPELDKYLQGLKIANGNRGGMFSNFSYLSLDAFDGAHYVVITSSGGHHAWLPDATLPAFKEVTATIRPVRSAAPRQTNSSGIGSILKLANMVLKAENAALGGSSGGGGGGGGMDFTQANMDFTQSLQNQTWSSVNAAANWNVQ